MPTLHCATICRRWSRAAGAVLVLAAAPSVAEEPWSAELRPAAGEFRSGSDPIEIELRETPADLGTRLHVLVDELDVTPFAVLEGELLTIALEPPLSGGTHEVTLLEQIDGSLAVRGTWPLEVRASPLFDSAGLGLDVTQNVWGRVAEYDTPGLPERTTADGAADVQAALETRGIRLSGHAPFIWDTLEENLADDNVSVGDWLLGGRGGPLALRVGHHDVGPATLAMDAFHRRGASLELWSERLRSGLTGFSFHGTPLVGFHDGLGLGHSSNRVSGVQLHTRPLRAEWGELDLTGVWLAGEAPDFGSPLSGSVGSDDEMKGSSWAFEGNASLLERVRLGGGFSESRSRFPGTSTLTDTAWSLQALAEPFPQAFVHELPLTWTLGFDASEVGTDYASLANPSLPIDRLTGALRTQASWAGLDLAGYAGRIEDNVATSDDVATMRADAWSIDASFSPATLLGGERRGILRWLGMPTVFGSYRYDRLEPHSIPASYAAPDLLADTRTDTGAVSLAFQYDRWSWSVDYTIIDDDVKTPGGISSLQHQPQVRADVSRGEVLLGGGVQIGLVDNDGAPDTTNILVTFSVRTPLYRDRVYFNGNVSYSRSYDDEDTLDSHSVNANGSIDWTVIEAAELHPGLLLSFLGSYQGLTDTVMPMADQDAYQLYLRATFTWPVVMGSL